MSRDTRRAAGRRRAWGRGPIILRFEPLEGRQLLATSGTALPDLVPVAFDTLHNLDWGDSFHAKGIVSNQGTAPVTTAFHVNFYASPTAALGNGSTLLGTVTVPAGLQPGQSAPFDQVVNLPTKPLSGVSSAGSVYVGLLVDPEGLVTESNKQNNAGNGQGYDTSLVTITPHLPSDLQGASLGVYPDQATWGQTVQVNAQILNNGSGDAPATRARLVLTPAGTTPGGLSDFTIGSISVPAIPANQTVALSQNFTLPAMPPASFGSSTQYVLSMVQDADFSTNSVSPHSASRGLGFDTTQMVISLPQGTTLPPSIPRPDVTITTLQAPTLPLVFGQSFQVSTTLQNKGNLESGAFRVRFLLVGSDGSLNNSLFLGDATLNTLKPGLSQNIVETLQLPAKLPNGLTLTAPAAGRIAVVVDPERSIDESNATNRVAYTSVISLQLVNADGTTTPVTLPTTTTPTPTTTTGATKPKTGTGTAAKPKTAPKARAGHTTTPVTPAAGVSKKKFGPKAPKHTLSHNLKVFPKHASKFFKDLYKHL